MRIVDHLRVDVFRRAEDGKPRTAAGGAAHVAPHLRRPPHGPITDCRHRTPSSLLLAFLAEDVLARVLDPLALVRLGLAECADFRGHVADLLPVDAGDDDLGRFRHRDRDAFRDRVNDIVAITELDLQVLALQGGAIPDAGDLEPALEALGDAGHRIGEQRTIRSPHRAGAFGIGARIHLDLVALDLGRDVAVQRDRKRALRPFTLTAWPSTLAVTPEGIATGFFPTRDMADVPLALLSCRDCNQKTVQRISPPTLWSRAS